MPSQQWRDANQELARKYRRNYYHRNKAAEIARSRETTEAYRERNCRIIREEKDRPCADCQIKYPSYVMHFDHLGDEAKDECVAVIARIPVSERRLRAEIAKCEVVCANCHAERTHRRRSVRATTEDRIGV